MVAKLVHVIVLITLFSSCTSKQFEEADIIESFRPEFHFTPEANWMNDPNGMVYYEGEYHLFYQYYPDSTVWGPMHWGHAVSTDLVQWDHLPVALYPDELGYIFSGSAVIDWNNTSGFGNQDQPPMVAIYTYHDPVGEGKGTTDFQTQGIAYSLDKGRTWTKYEGNPVVHNPGMRDFRDPKVMWNHEMNSWVMTLAVKDHISFYSSSDLKNWTFESDFGLELGSHEGVWECPDLFRLPVKETNEEKWVLLVSINPGAPNGGSGTQYFIGEFAEGVFTLEPGWKPVTHESVWLDYGTDNYAGVTWSDIPKSDGRRIFMGWMSNWQYAQVVPTERWRSAMTIARTLELSLVDSVYRVQSQPVKELESAFATSTTVEPSTLEDRVIIDVETFTYRADLNFELGEASRISLTLANKQGESFLIIYDQQEGVFEVDRSKSGQTEFQEEFSNTHRAPYRSTEKLNLTLFVDRSSIELFTEDGFVITEVVFPVNGYDKIYISKEGNVSLTGGEISHLSM